MSFIDLWFERSEEKRRVPERVSAKLERAARYPNGPRQTASDRVQAAPDPTTPKRVPFTTTKIITGYCSFKPRRNGVEITVEAIKKLMWALRREPYLSTSI